MKGVMHGRGGSQLRIHTFRTSHLSLALQGPGSGSSQCQCRASTNASPSSTLNLSSPRPLNRSWTTPATQRKFLIDIISKLGIDSNDFNAWYKINSKQIVGQGGEVLLKLQGGSPSKLFISLFPEHPWDVSKFLFKPRNYWNVESNQKREFLELQKKLGIAEGDYEAWYLVDTKKVFELGYEVLLKKHKSLSKLLVAMFPEHKWDLKSLQNMPRNFWETKANQRDFLLDLEKRFGISADKREGWYKVEYVDVAKNGGEPLLIKYGSLPKTVTSLIPEHNWDLTKFRSKANFLETPENLRAFLDKLGAKLGISETDFPAWYKVHTKDIAKNGGKYLLELYGNSVLQLLKGTFPEHPWDESKFNHRPQQFWHSLENQKRFLEEVGNRLGYKKGDLNRFYRLSTHDVLKNGGAGLLEVYNKSVSNALEHVYPDHKWLPWKFPRSASKRKWPEKDLASSLVSYVEDKLDIKDLSGWYRVTKKQLRELEIDGFIKSEAKLLEVLSLVYPDHPWETNSIAFSSNNRNGLK